MDNDLKDTYTTIIIVVAIIALAATIGHIVDRVADNTRLLIEKGYTRTTLPGSAYPEWVKPKGEL